MAITITEALAELKTIDKRIEKKRAFINQYAFRQEGLKDPLEKEGGSPKLITQEKQSIGDLLTRKIAIRRAIQNVNAETQVNILGATRSIADWLVWRRDVAPTERAFHGELRARLEAERNQARRNGATVVQNGEAQKPSDVVVNFSEQELAKEIEALEETLGVLDGQLSLKNATLFIEV